MMLHLRETIRDPVLYYYWHNKVMNGIRYFYHITMNSCFHIIPKRLRMHLTKLVKKIHVLLHWEKIQKKPFKILQPYKSILNYYGNMWKNFSPLNHVDCKIVGYEVRRQYFVLDSTHSITLNYTKPHSYNVMCPNMLLLLLKYVYTCLIFIWLHYFWTSYYYALLLRVSL